MLDLFGFECFATNSFEQLTINYANEVLQAQFNADVFAAASAEAVAEGIDLGKMPYSDNAACIDLFQGRSPPGLLPLLNEECALGDGSDANFLLKLSQAHHSNPQLRVPGLETRPGSNRSATSAGRQGWSRLPAGIMFSPAKRPKTATER